MALVNCWTCWARPRFSPWPVRSADVPSLGPPQRLRMALEELGPTFVKLGQVLSTRPDLLPPAYIAELARLQDTVPPAPWEPVRAQLEAELGAPVEKVFATLDPEPIAAASLAQVHAATLPDGAEVVVKVQRPDIEATINVDLDILADVARLLQTRTPLGELYDLPGIVEEFAATLRAELDFYREGHNADRFRANFADEPYLYIPKVYWDYTTRRVLVMERIRGIKIDDIAALDAAGYDRYRIGLHAARMVIKEVLEDGFFHADPHPGNFFVMPGEVIGGDGLRDGGVSQPPHPHRPGPPLHRGGPVGRGGGGGPVGPDGGGGAGRWTG
jgi:ubiquinone biosynthesis protein